MEKLPYVIDVLEGPTVHSPLIIRAICSGGAPTWAAWVLFVVGVAPILAGSQVLLHEVAADLLVGRVRPQSGQLQDPGALSWCSPACGQVIPGANRLA